MIKQTLEEWQNEAIEKFGPAARHWAFKCPKCGNVQTPADFVEKAGMKPEDAANTAYQDCIGRHIEGEGCNWAAYGLFGTIGNGRIVIAPDDGREVEVFDFAEPTVKVVTLQDMTLLPPAADKCQACAVDHAPEQPHNRDSLFYQYWFRQQHDRWPTWADAMEHCSDGVKEFWREQLAKRGIDANGQEVQE